MKQQRIFTLAIAIVTASGLAACAAAPSDLSIFHADGVPAIDTGDFYTADFQRADFQRAGLQQDDDRND